jgi:hypothetical protein
VTHMFAPLISSMPKLEAVVSRMEKDVTMRPPPPIISMGERLRAAYARARASDYGGLRMSELRRLPYAYWLPGKPSLTKLEPSLVARYWQDHLRRAAAANPRRATRWLKPLFFVYCESFAPEDPDFGAFAETLVAAIGRSAGPFGARLRKIHDDVGLFDPARGPVELANVLLSTTLPPPDALAQHLLWPAVVDGPLGDAMLQAATKVSPSRLREPSVVVRFVGWLRARASKIGKSPLLGVPVANALLKPWSGRQAPDEVKTVLIPFLLDSYGDPRIGSDREFGWAGVSNEARAVLLNWLVGDTLRGFIRLLAQTADSIWEYRQRFWMAYYERGHIEEAWLALGTDAMRLANRSRAEQHGMGYGFLEGGALSNQSVLILRIGHLIFTEWSHNGSLRAFNTSAAEVPELYQRRYHGNDLRAMSSLDFHGGANENPELRHMRSEHGTWQKKARDFIRRHTGVHLDDGEIL